MATENITTKAVLKNVRLSYVHLFKPEAAEGSSDLKYSVSIIIRKDDTENLALIKSAIKAAVAAGLPKWGGKKPAGLKDPLRDGDEDRPDMPEYEGCYFINASSKTKPEVVEVATINGKRQLVQITDEEKVYSGCYGHVSLNFFAYSTNGNKGIGAGLNNVMKTRDGEYLGGRASAATDFGDCIDDVDDFPGDDEDI